MDLDQLAAEAADLLRKAGYWESDIDEINYDYTSFEGTAQQIAEELDQARDVLSGTTELLTEVSAAFERMSQFREIIDRIEEQLSDAESLIADGPPVAERVIGELLRLTPAA